MFNLLLIWSVYALLVIFVSWIIPGIEIDNFFSAMLFCVVITLINAFIRPILLFITLPVNILTLGLFTLVINALMLMFASYVVPGFEVESFFSAFFGAILLSILTLGASKL